MDGLKDSEIRDLLAAEGLCLRQIAVRYKRKEGINFHIDSSEVRKSMIQNLTRENVAYWPLLFTKSDLSQAMLVVTGLFLQCLYICYTISEEIAKRKPISIMNIYRSHLQKRALRI